MDKADTERVREATSKTSLMHLAEKDDTLSLAFNRIRNGVSTPYLLQTITTRESDHHHVVLAVKQDKDSISPR